MSTLDFDPVAEPAPAARAPDKGIFDRRAGEHEKMTARKAVIDGAGPAEPEDPEKVVVSDVTQMQQIIDEVMGELLAPEDQVNEWKAAGYRTWSIAPRKAAKLTIGGIVGKVNVGQFREMVKAAVVGERGGSMLAVIRNQQWNGSWVPVAHGYRRASLGKDQHLFLLVEFCDISNSPQIKYNAKGEPIEADPAADKSGVLAEQMAEFLKYIKAGPPVAAPSPGDDPEKAAMAEKLARLEAMVAKLSADLGGTAPVDTKQPVAKAGK